MLQLHADSFFPFYIILANYFEYPVWDPFFLCQTLTLPVRFSRCSSVTHILLWPINFCGPRRIQLSLWHVNLDNVKSSMWDAGHDSRKIRCSYIFVGNVWHKSHKEYETAKDGHQKPSFLLHIWKKQFLSFIWEISKNIREYKTFRLQLESCVCFPWRFSVKRIKKSNVF